MLLFWRVVFGPAAALWQEQNVVFHFYECSKLV
jgi:hypothetical protein